MLYDIMIFPHFIWNVLDNGSFVNVSPNNGLSDKYLLRFFPCIVKLVGFFFVFFRLFSKLAAVFILRAFFEK
jgi:hypothetical protein